MTEAEWLACDDPMQMLCFLKEKVSERKSQLFAVACCRRIWDLIPVEQARRCVETTERYAEGIASREELDAAVRASMRACEEAALRREATGEGWGRVEQEAINAVGRVHRSEGGGRLTVPWAVSSTKWYAELLGEPRTLLDDPRLEERRQASEREEGFHQLALLLDLVGDPFRSVSFDPVWRTSVATSLAQAAYDERAEPSGVLDSVRLNVFADALEDVNCAAAVLEHLRSPGPHVRGCWALDLVLGKQ